MIASTWFFPTVIAILSSFAYLIAQHAFNPEINNQLNNHNKNQRQQPPDGFVQDAVGAVVDSPFSKQSWGSFNSHQMYFNFAGTYRPNVYFGLKSKRPLSPLVGIMWQACVLFSSKFIRYDPGSHSNIEKLRHDCDERDGLSRYGWLQHD